MSEHIFVFLFFIFVMNATFVSFICLATERLPHQLGWKDNPKENFTIISPPSSCNHCGKKIHFLYILPVIGYILSKGRCSYCNQQIPIKYPALEFIGGMVGVLIFFIFGFSINTSITNFLFLVLFFLALIDIYEHWIPAVVTYPLFWLGLAFSPYCQDPELRIIGAAVGFYSMYLSMAITSHWKKEDAFAGGDIALVACAGAWLGIGNIPNYLILSSIFFIAYALPLRFKGQKYVPMGPALATGFFICLL
ncbi:prepilin peptidase [Salmonella enterica]|nr:prepilin peptidase [Salmonella enterica]